MITWNKWRVWENIWCAYGCNWGHTNVLTDGHTDSWTYQWTSRWMYKHTDRCMDGCSGRHTDIPTFQISIQKPRGHLCLNSNVRSSPYLQLTSYTWNYWKYYYSTSTLYWERTHIRYIHRRHWAGHKNIKWEIYVICNEPVNYAPCSSPKHRNGGEKSTGMSKSTPKILSNLSL